jgi:RimJ/RimL family protein N-acetyltransferase
MPWVAFEPLSVDDRVALIRGWRENGGDADADEDGDLVVGVFLNGTPVGGGGLHRRIGPAGLEIGYWIHVDHVHRGYASELAAALTTAAFALPRIERVEIHHDRANTASAAVPRRLGYTLTDEQPREIVAPGQEGIGWIWTVTRAEWTARLGSSIGDHDPT